MDKICLVALNSQYVHTNLAVRLIKNLDKSDDTVVLEHTINNQMDLVLEDVVSRNPICVVFSCYIWNIEYVKRLISSLKKVLPNTIIALAGPEVSFNASDVLRSNKSADIVCMGAGEICYPQLKRALRSGDLSGVEGICYRQGEDIVVNPVKSKYDINTQEFPYYDIEDVKDRILYYETSRGCPFRCAYCISGITKGVDFMELSKVEESFEIFFRNNVKQVKLVDRTFNYPVKRAAEIIGIMLKIKEKYLDKRTTFHCELNPLLVSHELADIIAKAPKGFLQFEIGVQSTHAETLDAINRDVDLQKQYDNISMLTKLGNCKVYVDLIAGLPYENYEIFKQSFNDVYAMNAGGIHLGFLKVLKGSVTERTAAEHGMEYSDYAPYKILKSDYISYGELAHLEKIESLVDTYYNSGNFSSIIKYAVDASQAPYDFYDEFCGFLESREHFSRPHKFIYIYDVLYDFLKGSGHFDMDYAGDLLMHDYASNSKPRVYPQCMKNAYSQDKKSIAREFYNNPQNIERYLPTYAAFSPSTISRQCNIEIFKYDVTSPSKKKAASIVLYDYADGTKIHKIKLD